MRCIFVSQYLSGNADVMYAEEYRCNNVIFTNDVITESVVFSARSSPCFLDYPIWGGDMINDLSSLLLSFVINLYSYLRTYIFYNFLKKKIINNLHLAHKIIATFFITFTVLHAYNFFAVYTILSLSFVTSNVLV